MRGEEKERKRRERVGREGECAGEREEGGVRERNRGEREEYNVSGVTDMTFFCNITNHSSLAMCLCITN